MPASRSRNSPVYRCVPFMKRGLRSVVVIRIARRAAITAFSCLNAKTKQTRSSSSARTTCPVSSQNSRKGKECRRKSARGVSPRPTLPTFPFPAQAPLSSSFLRDVETRFCECVLLSLVLADDLALKVHGTVGRVRVPRVLHD
jgi:hypothetical protein